MSQQIPIAVAHGDGIGPEILEASLRIIPESGAELAIYRRGNTAGIDDSSWESLRRTSQTVNHARIAAIYQKVTAAGYDIVKTETLRNFDGQQGFTLAQGQ